MSDAVHPDGRDPVASFKYWKAVVSGKAPCSEATDVLIPEPTLAELAVNFTSSVSRWAAGGFPVVAEDEYQHRQMICSACEFWRTDGLFAHCGKCGCSRLKAWMGTSKCPINKW